jgi:hypothetical protein
LNQIPPERLLLGRRFFYCFLREAPLLCLFVQQARRYESERQHAQVPFAIITLPSSELRVSDGVHLHRFFSSPPYQIVDEQLFTLKVCASFMRSWCTWINFIASPLGASFSSVLIVVRQLRQKGEEDEHFPN